MYKLPVIKTVTDVTYSIGNIVGNLVITVYGVSLVLGLSGVINS